MSGASQKSSTVADPTRSEPAAARSARQRRQRLRLTILGLVLGWVYFYNRFVKEQGPLVAFFEILDTISDDFVLGALVAIVLGVGIALVFSATKLYSQILSHTRSFRLLEQLVYDQLLAGNWRAFFDGLIHLQDLPQPRTSYPLRPSSVVLSFSLIYVMSCVYVVLFSEALFFVAWSAGVDLPVDSVENAVLMPTLALAVPFSARVMAYVRYPYAQDYGDFMPGAVFVLLIVSTLGFWFGSRTQQFFLLRVYENGEYLTPFLRNGIFLAFIPVFFEAGFWLYELARDELDSPAESDPPA